MGVGDNWVGGDICDDPVVFSGAYVRHGNYGGRSGLWGLYFENWVRSFLFILPGFGRGCCGAAGYCDACSGGGFGGGFFGGWG